jgi:hypothetical protein
VFTARYALSPYIKRIRFVFKGLIVIIIRTKIFCILLVILNFFIIFMYLYLWLVIWCVFSYMWRPTQRISPLLLFTVVFTPLFHKVNRTLMACWNSDGVRGRKLELEHFLNQHGVDICLSWLVQNIVRLVMTAALQLQCSNCPLWWLVTANETCRSRNDRVTTFVKH